MIDTSYPQEIMSCPKEPLFTLIRSSKLSPRAVEGLLEDIVCFNAAALELIRPWIEAGLPRYKTLMYTPDELAFSLLAQQPPDWLNRQCVTFENLFRKALLAGDREASMRLKHLFATSGAGVRPEFLKDLLQEYRAVFSPVEELDLWIIKEKISNSADMSILHEIEELSVERPWLIVVLIYIFREGQPKWALDQLRTWEDKNYQPPAAVAEYVSVYLRHAIFNFLRNGDEEHYMWFFNLYYSLKNTHDLLRETLQHELLSDIAQEFARRDMTRSDYFQRNDMSTTSIELI